MSKRLKKKWSSPKIYVNDKRYFVKDDMSVGALRAYAVWVDEGKKVGA